MNAEEYLALGRIAERVIITFFAGFSIYAGYQLFRFGIVDPQSGELKGKALSVKLQKCGPGIFFALFGAVVLSLGLKNPLTISADVADKKGSQTNDLATEIVRKVVSSYNGNQAIALPLDICQSINTLEQLGPPNADGSLLVIPQRLQRLQLAVTNLSSLKQGIIDKKFLPSDLQLYRSHIDTVLAGQSTLPAAEQQKLKEIHRWASEALP